METKIIKYQDYKINTKIICQKQKLNKLINIIHKILKSKDKKKKKIVFTGEGNSGKSTIAFLLEQQFNNYAVVEIDNFILSRKHRQKNKLSGYNPNAFYLKKFAKVWKQINKNNNQFIYIPYYEHKTGNICRNRNCYKKSHKHKIKTKYINYLIEVGTFLWKKQLYNDKEKNFFFYNVDKNNKERLRRDVKERGYSVEYAKEHFNQLMKDKKYITNSLKYCKYLILKEKNLFSLYLIKKVNRNGRST